MPFPGSNQGYSDEQVIESFWLSIWTGASRLELLTLCRQISKALKIALPVKKGPWLDGIFAQIEILNKPFEYSDA